MATAPRVVQDVETLKALADPARLAILELMMVVPTRTWTAKELAGAIGMPPKKIYYHLGLLEQRGLLEVRDTQIVNGIIEKHYGPGQESIVFQRGSPPDKDGEPPESAEPAGTPAPAGSAEEMGQVVSALFDEVHTNILDGLRDGTAIMDRQAPDSQRVVVSYSISGMRPDRAGEFRTALLAVVEQFRGAGDPDEQPFELLVALHPRATATR